MTGILLHERPLVREQELTWARQYLALYANAVDPVSLCPPLDIDNDPVVVTGTSTGAIYSAFVALGPDRADPLSSDPQLQESTRCAGAILFESPSWYPAYESSQDGSHWPDALNSTVRAEQLLLANPADLVASSISTWMRSPASMAEDTPVFLAFDESLQDPNFARASPCDSDPAGSDPVLFDVLDQFVHDAWFGLIACEDLLCISASFHASQSRFWLDSAVDTSLLLSDQTDLVTGTFVGGVQDDELQAKALDWLLNDRATSTVRNTFGADTSFNSECYETITAPVICGTWRAKVDVSGHPLANLSALLTYSSAFPTPVLYSGFAIYVDIGLPALGVDFSSPVSGSAQHQIPIPNDASLAGLTFFTQAAIQGGGLEVCNGIDLLLGY